MHKKDIEELLANNIISGETAQGIIQYYESKKQPAAGLLLTIFGVVGAALAGLGIILIFAHNWDNFTRTTRTMLAFLPLVMAQGLSIFTYIKNKGRGWKETAAVLLFFAVGAAISLISQIYNIPGNMHVFTATWVLLCLPLVYIFQSYALWVLLLLYSTSYGINTGFGDGTPYLYIVFIALLLPFYLNILKNNPKANTAISSGWLLPLSILICLQALCQTESYIALIYIAGGCIFYSISILPYFTRSRLAAGGYRFFGIGTIVILLLISTFKILWNFTVEETTFSNLWLVAIVNATAIGLFVISLSKKRVITLYSATPVLYTLIFGLSFISVYAATILCNILLLTISIATVHKGIKAFHFGKLNFGLTIIALLTACRFFDTDLSFALRGILFLVVGLGFFAANYILIKKKQNNTLHEN